MKVKAILVAGGHGSRLLPFTRYTQKTLLPLYGRPVIDYALGTIRRAGIKDITIIANQFIGQIANHIGCGLPGERIHYVLEEEPLGVAQALELARPHNQNCRLMIYFSDNITAVEFTDDIQRFIDAEQPPGCVLLAREVEDPRAFGVAVLKDGKIVDIVEKPENPPSKLAIGGIYLYDERFWDFLDELYLADPDEFSISDVNRKYISLDSAVVHSSGGETWVDCGTPDGLFQAAVMAEEGILNPSPHRK
jgi:glucose-1-phosphate thymidylyltransferase|tara:strand:+ start:132 stop:878 length:747 start_codon:yes stop_codon:yes gene_type:complete